MTFAERAQMHICHAEGCFLLVPPKMFMCKKHWCSLPKALRDAVWAEYVPGQEVRMDPTPEYLNVTQRCINLIAVQEGRRRIGLEELRVRKTYVYKLIVQYPEEPNWNVITEYWGGTASPFNWNWPKRLTYLSQSSADRRANLLRSLGAHVTICRSEPVEFPTLEQARQAQTDALVEDCMQLRSSLNNFDQLFAELT